jgi:hypothetical protein
VAEKVVHRPAVTHLLVTREPDTGGFSVESPQLPGFAFGRPTLTEVLRDHERVLRDLGVSGPVRAHRQERGHTAEGAEFIIRAAEGPDFDARKEVLDRLRRILSTDDRHELMAFGTGPTGEVVFVAAMPNDTVGDLIDQMYDDRDAIVICAPVIEEGVYTMAFFSGDLQRFDEPLQTLEEAGWDRDTKISQVLLESASGRRKPRILVRA